MSEAVPCQSPSVPENSHWCIQVTIQSEPIGKKRSVARRQQCHPISVFSKHFLGIHK